VLNSNDLGLVLTKIIATGWGVVVYAQVHVHTHTHTHTHIYNPSYWGGECRIVGCRQKHETLSEKQLKQKELGAWLKSR
jgi:hypothetical protein